MVTGTGGQAGTDQPPSPPTTVVNTLTAAVIPTVANHDAASVEQLSGVGEIVENFVRSYSVEFSPPIAPRASYRPDLIQRDIETWITIVATRKLPVQLARNRSDSEQQPQGDQSPPSKLRRTAGSDASPRNRLGWFSRRRRCIAHLRKGVVPRFSPVSSLAASSSTTDCELEGDHCLESLVADITSTNQLNVPWFYCKTLLSAIVIRRLSERFCRHLLECYAKPSSEELRLKELSRAAAAADDGGGLSGWSSTNTIEEYYNRDVETFLLQRKLLVLQLRAIKVAPFTLPRLCELLHPIPSKATWESNVWKWCYAIRRVLGDMNSGFADNSGGVQLDTELKKTLKTVTFRLDTPISSDEYFSLEEILGGKLLSSRSGGDEWSDSASGGMVDGGPDTDGKAPDDEAADQDYVEGDNNASAPEPPPPPPPPQPSASVGESEEDEDYCSPSSPKMSAFSSPARIVERAPLSDGGDQQQAGGISVR